MKKGFLLFRYIAGEILPTFLIGVVLFVSILLVFQVLRLTETMLVHQVGFRSLFRILFYLAISFMPALIPMSLIFSVLITYHKLSSNSELIGMQALGYSSRYLATPALSIGCFLTILSLITTFRVGPWGNYQFELLMKEIVNSKLVSSIRSGTFSEGFFDIVVYTDSIDPETKIMKGVFLYDERKPEKPTTIVAEQGQLLVEKNPDSYAAFLRLKNGSIHNPKEEKHSKIEFDKYDMNLITPIKKSFRTKSKPSLTDRDLRRLIKETKNKKKLNSFRLEFFNRLFLSLSCLAFSLVGLAIGLRTKARAGNSGSGLTSVLVILLYWALYITGNSMGHSLALPPFFAAGTPFFTMTSLGLYLLIKKKKA